MPVRVEQGVVVQLPVEPQLTRLQFRWRYTTAEQVAIKRAEDEHPDANVRATLKVLRESLAEADFIDVTDARTIAGVQYHAAVGLIAASRIDEILAPPA